MKGDAVLKATVHPIERMDDHVVLTVDYSFSEDSETTTDINVKKLNEKDGTSPFYVSRVRLLDLARDRVWEAGRIGNDESATTQGSLSVRGKGDTATAVTFFGPVDVDHVDVMLPKLGLVRDVPVVEGGPGTADLGSLGLSGDSVRYWSPASLESLVRAYDDDTSAQKAGDAQTVVIASDVLFATDVAELSPEAAARVEQVAGQIAAVAEGGEVRVVGHTDDVLSEEYNLDLSQRRAASVADRMSKVLGSSFRLSEEGKGESEPVAEGTSPEARAANRRVEIEFTASEPVQLTEKSTSIPDTTDSTATGHEPVSYTVSDGYKSNDYTLEVLSVVRREGYLVGPSCSLIFPRLLEPKSISCPTAMFTRGRGSTSFMRKACRVLGT